MELDEKVSDGSIKKLWPVRRRDFVTEVVPKLWRWRWGGWERTEVIMGEQEKVQRKKRPVF